jgi:hypothetical protein
VTISHCSSAGVEVSAYYTFPVVVVFSTFLVGGDVAGDVAGYFYFRCKTFYAAAFA